MIESTVQGDEKCLGRKGREGERVGGLSVREREREGFRRGECLEAVIGVCKCSDGGNERRRKKFVNVIRKGHEKKEKG